MSPGTKACASRKERVVQTWAGSSFGAVGPMFASREQKDTQLPRMTSLWLLAVAGAT